MKRYVSPISRNLVQQSSRDSIVVSQGDRSARCERVVLRAHCAARYKTRRSGSVTGSKIFHAVVRIFTNRRIVDTVSVKRAFAFCSLKTVFVAGEFCDYKTKTWAEKAFKVPILNNWWQSETGHPITALCLDYGHNPGLPKYSTGLPIPGYRGKFRALKRSNVSKIGPSDSSFSKS